MARRFDADARLAEGRPAVETTQTYVSACRRLGYAHPDLTAHDGQLHDRYGTEDGMDLGVLDDDGALLSGALEAATEALRIQRAQLAEVRSAWRGSGGLAAEAFLRRHCDTGAALTEALGEAVRAVRTLREELWGAVDAKADAAVRIDERAGAQRPAWLLAARAVIAGHAGNVDARAAEDVVEHQVRPYVAAEVGAHWLAAMHAAQAGVAAAYDRAASGATPPHGPAFAVPGDFGVPVGGAAAEESPVAQAVAPALAPGAPGSAVSAAPPGVSGAAGPTPDAAVPRRDWPPEDATFPLDSAVPLDDPVAPFGDPGSAGDPGPSGDPGPPLGDAGLPFGGGLPLSGPAPGAAGFGPGIGEAVGRLLRRGGSGFPEALAGTDPSVENIGEPEAPAEPEGSTLVEHTDPHDADGEGEEGEEAEIRSAGSQSDADDPGDVEGDGGEPGDSDAPDNGAEDDGDPDAAEPGSDPAESDAAHVTDSEAPQTPCQIAADQLPQAGG